MSSTDLTELLNQMAGGTNASAAADKAHASTSPSRPVSRDPDAPVPTQYQQVVYGSTIESRLAQARRLQDGSKKNLYGAVRWKDSNGVSYQATAHSDRSGHAEEGLLDEIRAQVAQRYNIRPDEVDFTQITDAKIFVEYSPCNTWPAVCQELIARLLPDAEVTYGWPWSPRAVRDQSRAALSAAVAKLFERNAVGPV